jgi:hypothetical protein
MEANKGINLEKSISEKEVHDGNNADSGMSIDFTNGFLQINAFVGFHDAWRKKEQRKKDQIRRIR